MTRKPNNIIRVIQPSEFKELSLPRAIPKVYLVNQCRGRAYLKRGFVTIPLWASKKNKGYLLWYISHELSHMFGNTQLHNVDFYKQFKMICPLKFQHHELKYKPSAIGFGISRT